MRIVVLVAFAAWALTACAEKSAWKVERSDLYRVSDYEEEPHGSRAGPPKPFFMVKKVVAAPGSVLGEVVQFQVLWCDSPDRCNYRDYSLQVNQHRSDREEQRTSFESGANCTIVKHALAGDRITIRADVYSSSQFTAAECEAGVSTRLPPNFVQTSSTTISGALVKQGS
jgi:hypothetical protein